MSWFKSKKSPPKVEIPKEIEDLIPVFVKEILNAKPKACPHIPFSMSPQVKFCDRPLLAGSKFCFWHTPSTKKYDPEIMKEYFGDSRTLKEAVEKEMERNVSLAGAYLVDAGLGGNWFERGINASGKHLEFANLTNAHLSYACLKGTNLAGAKLENAYLSDADIRDANMSHANLHNAKFRQNDFAGVKGLTKESFRTWKWGVFPVDRILEDFPDQSVGVYRSLVAYFSARGALDDASWAAYRSRVVLRKLMKKNLSTTTPIADALIDSAFLLGEPTNAKRLLRLSVAKRIINLLALLLSYVACYTFGYGEKPLRVVLAAGLTITTYAALYYWLRAITAVGFWNALYFSIVTFTTLGYGDVAPRPQFRMLAATEALVGLVLVGLFLFTLSRRAVGRG